MNYLSIVQRTQSLCSSPSFVISFIMWLWAPPWTALSPGSLILKARFSREFLVVEWIKDPVLSLPWLWLQLWRRFNPWPGEFPCAIGSATHTNTHMQKKKRERERETLLVQNNNPLWLTSWRASNNINSQNILGGRRQCQNESSRMPRLRVWLTEVLLIILGGWSHKKYNEVFLAGVDGKLTTPDAELRHLFRCLSTWKYLPGIIFILSVEEKGMFLHLNDLPSVTVPLKSWPKTSVT